MTNPITKFILSILKTPPRTYLPDEFRDMEQRSENIDRLVRAFLILLVLAVIAILAIALMGTGTAHAKGIVDPSQLQSDGSWASTHGEDPTFQPRWLETCGFTALHGAYGYDMQITGSLPKGSRVLVTDLWQGWAYLYVEEAWVPIPSLCKTWQPAGWEQNP